MRAAPQRAGGAFDDKENKVGNTNTGKSRRAANAKHADFKVEKKDGKQGHRKDVEFGKEFKNEMFENEAEGDEEIKQLGKRSDADKKATGWGASSDFDREIYRKDRAAGRR